MTDTAGETGGTTADNKENFAALLEESFGNRDDLVGTVVVGTIIAIENDMAVVDVGLKSEGRVPLKEFSVQGQPAEVGIGDTVEVYLERMENLNGETVLSREKARREEAWEKLEDAFAKDEHVSGVIFGRVKGGFTVDLSGAVAFLPGSQVDVRPVRDIAPLMGQPQPFQILKMDRRRGNIVVSRRAVLEEARAAERQELIANIHEGQVLDGVVKNITDYGAFVDLGGVDGLLHVTDMAWRRINHPSEAVQIGQTVKVQVVRLNPETQRISLGMKQLEADPWDGVEGKYPVNMKLKGRVTNITDYGAFVELEPGVEGLVHVSEMSWTKKNVHPGKIVSTSQEVEVMVLDVDPVKRRISLGIKQCTENPWDEFHALHPEGSEVEGEVKSITEFGIFIGLTGDIDGMVHLSDLDWDRAGEEVIGQYNKGDIVRAKVLSIDIEKERVSLGVKQLSQDPFTGIDKFKKGDTVTCTVAEIATGGIEVSFEDNLQGFIRKADLSRDRSEQRPERFAVGDKVDATIMSIDRDSRRVTLSIKALEIADEREAMAQYGSSDSGASLGDILGAAISRAREAEAAQSETDTEESSATAASEEESAVEDAEPEAEEAAVAPEEAEAETEPSDSEESDTESEEEPDSKK
ncbi:MAG: 30S ribosomal protein S1 [Alphaproteobacteria bacterium]|nr:30S ribosomal protein S1 [Alphaproteobacteria bacterium]|tara:strand:+ start:477 stop:2384 length:1908 start_codon:yes stop_codon:yes gene_type:complete